MKMILIGLLILGSISTFAQVQPPMEFFFEREILLTKEELVNDKIVASQLNFLNSLPQTSCSDFKMVNYSYSFGTHFEKHVIKCVNQNGTYKLVVKIAKKAKKEAKVTNVKLDISLD